MPTTHLQRDAILHVQRLLEQPSSRGGIANVTRIGVNSVQRRLARPRFPDVGQCHTAAARAAVRGLEVQPLG